MICETRLIFLLLSLFTLASGQYISRSVNDRPLWYRLDSVGAQNRNFQAGRSLIEGPRVGFIRPRRMENSIWAVPDASLRSRSMMPNVYNFLQRKYPVRIAYYRSALPLRENYMSMRRQHSGRCFESFYNFFGYHSGTQDEHKKIKGVMLISPPANTEDFPTPPVIVAQVGDLNAETVFVPASAPIEDVPTASEPKDPSTSSQAIVVPESAPTKDLPTGSISTDPDATQVVEKVSISAPVEVPSTVSELKIPDTNLEAEVIKVIEPQVESVVVPMSDLIKDLPNPSIPKVPDTVAAVIPKSVPIEGSPISSESEIPSIKTEAMVVRRAPIADSPTVSVSNEGISFIPVSVPIEGTAIVAIPNVPVPTEEFLIIKGTENNIPKAQENEKTTESEVASNHTPTSDAETVVPNEQSVKVSEPLS